MKTIEIKQGTWHFWMAEALGWKATREEKVWETKDGVTYLAGYETVPNDFCSYSRRVMIGLFICAVIATVIGLDLYGCYRSVVFWIDCIRAHKMLDASNWAATGTVSMGCALFIGLYCGINMWWDRRGKDMYDSWASNRRAAKWIKRSRQEEKERTPPPPKDPFLGAWYESFKEKVCFKIKVTK